MHRARSDYNERARVDKRRRRVRYGRLVNSRRIAKGLARRQARSRPDPRHFARAADDISPRPGPADSHLAKCARPRYWAPPVHKAPRENWPRGGRMCLQVIEARGQLVGRGVTSHGRAATMRARTLFFLLDRAAPGCLPLALCLILTSTTTRLLQCSFARAFAAAKEKRVFFRHVFQVRKLSSLFSSRSSRKSANIKAFFPDSAFLQNSL